MKSTARGVRLFMVVVCVLLWLGGFSVRGQQNGTGYIKVKANPTSAGVFIDGKYVGPAANFGFACKYAVPAGEHEIVLRDPRCQDFTRKVTIEAGKTTSISQSLQPGTLESPPYGLLRIQGGSSKFDAVFVNDQFMGHVDEFDNFAQGLLLNPGEYTLKVVSPAGKQELEQKIKIEVNKTTRIKVGSAG